MESNEYVRQVLKTESTDFEAIRDRLGSPGIIRLLHAVMGMATEAGEAVDAVKKHLFYGKDLDLANLAEEIGDSLWYVAVALDELGSTFPYVMEKNIDKLQTRYGGSFSKEAAVNRNLSKEREVLTSKGGGTA